MSKQLDALAKKSSSAMKDWLALGHALMGSLAVEAAYRDPLRFGDIVPKLKSGRAGYRVELGFGHGTADVRIAIRDTASGEEVGVIFEYHTYRGQR